MSFYHRGPLSFARVKLSAVKSDVGVSYSDRVPSAPITRRRAFIVHHPHSAAEEVFLFRMNEFYLRRVVVTASAVLLIYKLQVTLIPAWPRCLTLNASGERARPNLRQFFRFLDDDLRATLNSTACQLDPACIPCGGSDAGPPRFCFPCLSSFRSFRCDGIHRCAPAPISNGGDASGSQDCYADFTLSTAHDIDELASDNCIARFSRAVGAPQCSRFPAGIERNLAAQGNAISGTGIGRETGQLDQARARQKLHPR